MCSKIESFEYRSKNSGLDYYTEGLIPFNFRNRDSRYLVASIDRGSYFTKVRFDNSHKDHFSITVSRDWSTKSAITEREKGHLAMSLILKLAGISTQRETRILIEPSQQKFWPELECVLDAIGLKYEKSCGRLRYGIDAWPLDNLIHAAIEFYNAKNLG
ncbi:MAG: hypothetical protein QM537_05255 [Candidatus Symbiobacter sp.]|nr:hypothetical protein [Candidatus Symbiobacter sp.]